MMIVTGGTTDVTTYFALRLAADGTAATGLDPADFDLQYVRSAGTPSTKVDGTALGLTNTEHTDNYGIEIDATDQPGLYRVDWPDAAFAAGVREVILSVKCATAFTEHLRVVIDPLGAPAGASMSADVAAVKAETALIVADTDVIGAAGAGLTAVPWNSNWDSEVESECTDALNTYDPPKKSELDSAHATTDALITAVDVVADLILEDTAVIGALGVGLTDLGGMSTGMKAEVNAEADTALSDYDPPTKDELDSAHSTTNGKIDAVDNFVDTEVAAIKSVVDDILVDTDVIGAAGVGLTDLGGMSTGMKAEINAEADTALTDFGPPTNTQMEARTLVAASYFDPAADAVANVTLTGTCTTNTDMRGTDSAALASVCTEVRLAELAAANLPADVAAILVDSDTTIPGLISALNDFDPAADAVANVTLVATTTNVTNTVAANLEQISGSNIVETSSGRMVGNFNVFFDNDDALTTKTVDDHGAGDATASSQTTIISHLTDIKGATFSSSTDTLELLNDDLDTLLSRTASGDVTVSSPFNATSNNITVNAGDTYNAASGQRITIDSTAWPNLSGATVTDAVKMRSRDRRHTITVDVALVATGGGTQTIAIDLTAAQTADMVVGAKVYDYDVNPALATSEVVTLVKGKVTVNVNP